MKVLKIFMIMLVFVILVTGSAFSSVESDANTNGISVVASENSVYIHWNDWSQMKYYEFTVEDIYGSYSQLFTLFENYKSIGLTDPGVYKVTLEGFDGSSSVPYDMGYYYFGFGFGSSSIDPVALADMIASKINESKEKVIDKKVFTFRAVWNSGWWSAFSIGNTTDGQLNYEMEVVDLTTNATSSTTLTAQPKDILSNTTAVFLGFVNLEPTDSGNYLFTFRVPEGVDVEFYLGQLRDGEIQGLTKDTTIDSYIYKDEVEE